MQKKRPTKRTLKGEDPEPDQPAAEVKGMIPYPWICWASCACGHGMLSVSRKRKSPGSASLMKSGQG